MPCHDSFNEEEKQEEIGVEDKEGVDVQPAKKVCTIERKPVALPEEMLSILAKASYFLNLTYSIQCTLDHKDVQIKGVDSCLHIFALVLTHVS